ncbi:GntR family transcriptional regulator [Nonomuraea sp. NPDC049625]|uniref:FadR/GntR family transcriptional regulator n=1 Tax=Nonomuraea sp. NPDC049625 TaxID=3155775 RepID=UPI003432BAF0
MPAEGFLTRDSAHRYRLGPKIATLAVAYGPSGPPEHLLAGYNGRGVHGHTVTELGMRIVSGVLPQGAVLDLSSLGAELDLSMTALREALKVLTAKGLLEARQHRGTVVLPRERWNLLDADVIRWRGGWPVANRARPGPLYREPPLRWAALAHSRRRRD